MTIDRQKLEAMLGNSSKVDAFIALFKKESRLLITSINKAWSDGDISTVNRCAHSLKNHFNYVGFDQWSTQCRIVEELSENGHKSDQLKVKIETLITSLNANLATFDD